jgi:hypothetical protein
VVGLTSPANVAFCESLGCYSRVLTYDQLDQVAADAACAYIDFAGNAGLRREIHTRFANLRYSCSIGGTHVEQLGSAKDLPGPRATLFFAPAQIKKRSADWGAAELGRGWCRPGRPFTPRCLTRPRPGFGYSITAARRPCRRPMRRCWPAAATPARATCCRWAEAASPASASRAMMAP